MRKLNIFVVISLIFATVASITCYSNTAFADSEVIFPDPGLNQSICIELGIDYGDPIMQSQLDNLTELTASDMGIVDITGISNCTSLVLLELYRNNISDISQLEGLTNLTQIGFDSNNISDISVLSTLPNLVSIELEYNDITDLSPLSSLSNLLQINIGNNNISDIGPLSSLSSLSQLWAAGNKIDDLSPLSNLTNLIVLLAPLNNISNVSALANIPGIRVVELSYNNISDVSSLENLTSLSYLGLSYNCIENISSLVTPLNFEDSLYILSNPLNTNSFLIDIPALLDKGVSVENDTPYTLIYSAGLYGNISGLTYQLVGPGFNGTLVTAVPNSGHSFINWSDASIQNPRIDTNVSQNLSAVAYFSSPPVVVSTMANMIAIVLGAIIIFILLGYAFVEISNNGFTETVGATFMGIIGIIILEFVIVAAI